MKILWQPLALQRVNETIDFIARDRPLAAEKWAAGIFDLVERLQQSPKRGRVVPEVGREQVRELLYRNHRIIYRLDPDSVSVLTVRYARRLLDLEEID